VSLLIQPYTYNSDNRNTVSIAEVISCRIRCKDGHECCGDNSIVAGVWTGYLRNTSLVLTLHQTARSVQAGALKNCVFYTLWRYLKRSALSLHMLYNNGEQGSWVCIVISLRDGLPVFDSRQEQRFFLFATVSRPTLGSTQPPLQWESRAVSPGVKQPWREAQHSLPSSAGVRTCGAIPPHSRMSSWRGTYRDNFTSPCVTMLYHFQRFSGIEWIKWFLFMVKCKGLGRTRSWLTLVLTECHCTVVGILDVWGSYLGVEVG
jgi:hypothetical protein